MAALVACVVIAGCGSTTEYWKPDTVVEETVMAPPRTEISRTAGWLEVRRTQSVEETRRPVERMQLLHEKLVSTVAWDDLGMVVMYILGSVVVLAIYVFLYASAWDGGDD